MTRAEIIAALKEAKGQMPARAASEFSMIAVKALGFNSDGAYQLLYSALSDEHPWSLAFAVMLVEREKPGWRWEVASESGDFAACAFISGDDDSEMSSAYGATPAIALVIALIGGE